MAKHRYDLPEEPSARNWERVMSAETRERIKRRNKYDIAARVNWYVRKALVRLANYEGLSIPGVVRMLALRAEKQMDAELEEGRAAIKEAMVRIRRGEGLDG